MLITEEDVHRKVRLRNNTIAIITHVRVSNDHFSVRGPILNYDNAEISWNTDGSFYGGGRISEYDIISFIDEEVIHREDLKKLITALLNVNSLPESLAILAEQAERHDFNITTETRTITKYKVTDKC